MGRSAQVCATADDLPRLPKGWKCHKSRSSASWFFVHSEKEPDGCFRHPEDGKEYFHKEKERDASREKRRGGGRERTRSRSGRRAAGARDARGRSASAGGRRTNGHSAAQRRRSPSPRRSRSRGGRARSRDRRADRDRRDRSRERRVRSRTRSRDRRRARSYERRRRSRSPPRAGGNRFADRSNILTVRLPERDKKSTATMVRRERSPPRRQPTIIINGVEFKNWPSLDPQDDYKLQARNWKGADTEPLPGRFAHQKADEEAQKIIEGLHFEHKLAANFNFVPHGLIYMPDFLSEEEEKETLEGIDGRGASVWRNEKNRRTQQYGFEFFHDHVEPARWPLPPWATKIAEKVVKTGLLHGPRHKEGMLPNQLIVNEYFPGQGILQHTDRTCFGEEVVLVSLSSDITMSFSNAADDMARRWGNVNRGECIMQLLQHRSLVVFKSNCRHKWRHGIAESMQDVGVDGKPFKRGRRVSLTFRYVDESDPDAVQPGKWGGVAPKAQPPDPDESGSATPQPSGPLKWGLAPAPAPAEADKDKPAAGPVVPAGVAPPQQLVSGPVRPVSGPVRPPASGPTPPQPAAPQKPA